MRIVEVEDCGAWLLERESERDKEAQHLPSATQTKVCRINALSLVHPPEHRRHDAGAPGGMIGVSCFVRSLFIS